MYYPSGNVLCSVRFLQQCDCVWYGTTQTLFQYCLQIEMAKLHVETRLFPVADAISKKSFRNGGKFRSPNIINTCRRDKNRHYQTHKDMCDSETQLITKWYNVTKACICSRLKGTTRERICKRLTGTTRLRGTAWQCSAWNCRSRRSKWTNILNLARLRARVD